MKHWKSFIMLFAFCLHAHADNHSQPAALAGGIKFMSGGIGQEEAELFKENQKKYSVRFIFSEGNRGRLIMPINANIYDAQSKLVFRIVDAGPQLLVDLPAGTYTILASYHGDRLRHKFTLKPNAHRKIVLNWKNVIEEDQPDEEVPNEGAGTSLETSAESDLLQ